MGDSQEQDHYEERLKEVFNSFDSSGCGSLSSEELSDLCQSLHLDDATSALLHRLLQNQDHLSARVDFDQFKNALILVLSSTIEPPQEEQEASPKPESPEIQPKFVKGAKRYGRRSTPEFTEPDLSEVTNINPADVEDLEDNDDSAVPRKRERWNVHEMSLEEYEAEGQMHLWNPDEPSRPRGSLVSLSGRLEEQVREACEKLAIAWDGCAGHSDLLTLSEHLDLELNGDVLLSLSGDGVMNVQEFVSRILNHNKPPTPSASTPYRQLKRHHSTQPFDEGGRRISALPSTFGVRLFSILDDGSGYTPTESILDVWIEEGVENSAEILQALNFDLDGKLSLSDLTTALENELLVTKNRIHQAALASFKAEIRYLLERVDQEIWEKEKLQSDLERAEKQKTQLATEVDEHHSAIEHTNNLNLRKLEQDYKEKLAAVRSELVKEMEQIQQQAGLQREELGAALEKIMEDEALLRDHLSISVKENRRLEVDLLDCTEKLAEAQSQVTKLQTNLENIMKDKFGDLDPGSADFLLQEERVKQLRSSYEAQCRELQDRIDELQAELQGFRNVGPARQPHGQPLSDELESKSPGTESDPGIGSDEMKPFSMSLEAEMMLEQLKEQHLYEMEDLRNQLESKINEFEKIVEKQRVAHEDQKAALMLLHQQEVQVLKERMAGVQSQLQQVEVEQTRLEQNQIVEREELKNQREEEVGNLRQQLLEAHTHIADLEEQVNTLEDQQAEADENFLTKMEELRNQHAMEIRKLKEEQVELMERNRNELQELKTEFEKRLSSDLERQKKVLEESHENSLKAQLEEAKLKFEEERDEMVKKMSEQWQGDRVQLELLEEEMLRRVREQEEKEKQLREQWESERAQLQEHHQKVLLDGIAQERLQLQEECEQRENRLKEECEKERMQYEGMIQDRLNEERARLEENHGEVLKELMEKHTEERNVLGAMLTELRHDIAQERKEVEICFTQRIREVENRFSDDQESAAKRFQADVSKIEEDYQNKLTALSEGLVVQKLHWEAELQKAVEEQRQAVESMAQERERLYQEWETERQELEHIHNEEVEALKLENKQLLTEVDEMMSDAQRKEIELSMQLNNLHIRLQEKRELLDRSESRACRIQLLLDQTVRDWKKETVKVFTNSSELDAKHNKTPSVAERRAGWRTGRVTELADLKMKVEELQMLLKQAALDFKLEKDELQEHMSILQNRSGEDPEADNKELRKGLKIQIQELNMELKHFLVFVEKFDCKEVNKSNDINKNTKNCNSSGEETSQALDERDDDDDVSKVTHESDNGVEYIKAAPNHGEDDFGTNQDEGVRIWVEDTVNQDQDGPTEETLDQQLGNCSVVPDPRTEQGEPHHEGCARTSSFSEPLRSHLNTKNRNQVHCEATSLQKETRPQDWEDEAHHVVFSSVLEETGDPAEHFVTIDSLPKNSYRQEVELVLNSDFGHKNHNECGHDCLETLDEENHKLIFLKLRSMCSTVTEENLLLHQKISLLQQKTELLEKLLAHHNQQLQTSRQALEENYNLKVQMLVLLDHVNEVKRNNFKLTDLQFRYEDCMCENTKLKDQINELKKEVFDVSHNFQDRHVSPVDEISRMRAEKAQLFDLWSEFSGLDSEQAESPSDEAFLHSISRLQAEVCCKEFEEQNTILRRAIVELQNQSEALNKTTLARRSAASCLAEENVILRKNIAALKGGDLKKFQDELTQTLEDLKQEKFVAQQAADHFKKKISEMSLQSQNLEEENGLLTEKNAQNAASMEGLRQQLVELLKETERREMFHTEERNRMAACVSALEAELTKALEDAAQLEERNIQLSQQLSNLRDKTFRLDSMENQLIHFEDERKTVEEETAGLRSQLAKAQDRVKTADESLQVVNRQTSRLKSDLVALQQEKDSLKQEVSALHKQLQNSNNKNHILEMALHSSGLQNQSKRLYREEMSRLAGQEQQLLRQENSRLQAEVHSIKSNLIQSREKVRQLDATVLLLNKHKQQSQSSLLKALELENASLKQELEAQRERPQGCEAGQTQADLESLQQENETLKAQMTRMSSQVLESFQAQLAGLVPPSPHRVQRGQHGGEEPDNMQQEGRERKMKNMEERMKEIELSLRNVKILLKEKVAQLKDQLHKNGKADVLIKDLYTENTQLLKALDVTEQRQKVTEKKNYLLEEKISSLNKIVRDLNPSTLPGLSYNYKYQ